MRRRVCRRESPVVVLRTPEEIEQVLSAMRPRVPVSLPPSLAERCRSLAEEIRRAGFVFPADDLEEVAEELERGKPCLTVEIRRTGESEGVRITTGGGAIAELARHLVEGYCRMLSAGVPPNAVVDPPPDSDLAEGSYRVETFRETNDG